jgi:D-3-phosphoglycerate dehydrogenase
LGNVLSVFADANLNVVDMVNQSRDEIAYNIIDVEGEIGMNITELMGDVEGVIGVRFLD